MPLSVRVSIGQVEGNLDQTRWETTGVNGVALTNGVVCRMGTVRLVLSWLAVRMFPVCAPFVDPKPGPNCVSRDEIRAGLNSQLYAFNGTAATATEVALTIGLGLRFLFRNIHVAVRKVAGAYTRL